MKLKINKIFIKKQRQKQIKIQTIKIKIENIILDKLKLKNKIKNK
jgi:hypothetical protein